MLPIGDDEVQGGPVRLVTVALIVANVLAFLLELNRSPSALSSFIQAWGVVPQEYSARTDLVPHIPLPFWTTLFTSMFLHFMAHVGGFVAGLVLVRLFAAGRAKPGRGPAFSY